MPSRRLRAVPILAVSSLAVPILAVLAVMLPAVATELRSPPASGAWNWVLDGRTEPADRLAFVDLDGEETPAATVSAWKRRGTYVACYLNAGAWEEWRSDAAAFPGRVLGRDYAGWPGERWLDIRRLDLLGPVLEARLDRCATKGFDGVEPDNMDGYDNDTGFPLTRADQLRFARWLTDAAHARGLSVALKNAPELAADLVNDVDWALLEDCARDGWCDAFAAYPPRGKPVFMVEYDDGPAGFAAILATLCATARRLGFNPLLKRRALDEWSASCR